MSEPKYPATMLVHWPTGPVSYKARWWHRRRFACGFVVLSEAVPVYDDLERKGRRPRFHIHRARGPHD